MDDAPAFKRLERAGYVKEEMNEDGKSPESQRKAQKGRNVQCG